MTSSPNVGTSAHDVAQLVAQLELEHPSLRIDTSAEALDGHSRDRWPESAKWSPVERARHLPLAVARPSSAVEVAAILKAASAANLAVVPYGAGSGVVGAVVNADRFVSLDLSGLSGEPVFDDERAEVTVGAGVPASVVEAAANARGRRIPHYPQSLGLASVGGLVATRSSGTFSSKYGNIEDLLVALEVVLADGTTVRTKAVPRSSTGPSLTQLFVGSEGTLGVITSVTLRTFPQAASAQFGGVAFASVAEGVVAVRAILDGGIRPAVIRLYDAAEAEHLFQHSGVPSQGRALLILGFDGNPAVVQAERIESTKITAACGGVDLGPAPGDTWERSRFDASWLDRGNADPNHLADAIEVSASWPVLAALHDRTLAALFPHVDRAYAHFSHFYPNGGALYFIFFTSGPDPDDAVARYRAAWAAALRTVIDMGGSISHHHGIGEARKGWMREEHGEVLTLLDRIKQAFDPLNLLSPGKLGMTSAEERNRA